MEKKVCNKCNKEKSITEYYKRRDAKDGLRTECKECKNAQDKKYREENPEKERARHKKYYQENPEKEKARKKKYYQENPDYNKKYYQENKEKERARKKKWKKENPGKVRASARLNASKRRARKRNTQVENITEELLNKYWIKKGIDPQRCYHCNKTFEGLYEHLDHYYPLSKGGTHTKENLVPSCEYCNKSKGNKTPEEWKEYQAL